MPDTQDPPITQITFADFDAQKCQRIIDSVPNSGYLKMWSAFVKEAQNATSCGQSEQGQIWRLLSNACSLMLKFGDSDKPFRPVFEEKGLQSTVVDDFSGNDLSFFKEIIPHINDHLLKARLADLAWVACPKGGIKNARDALASYRQIVIDPETWHKYGAECWERAIQLSKKIDSTQLHPIETEIVEYITNSDSQVWLLPLKLATLLSKCKLGKGQEQIIASKLASLAQDFVNRPDWYWAELYLEATIDWYEKINDKENSGKIKAQLAEVYASDATSRTSGDNPSNMAASIFYEKAIMTYRRIPKKERPTYNVDQRMSELLKLKSQAIQLAQGEAEEISTEPTDIQPIINQARAAVTGKSKFESLVILTRMIPFMNKAEMEKEAINTLDKNSILAHIPSTIYSSDGRVVAKTDGTDFDSNFSGDTPFVQHSMIQEHDLLAGLRVQGMILPALEIISLEHRITEEDFCYITQRTTIIPPGREYLFAKGLFAGYNHDWITTIHILVPQLEHWVRCQLKLAGAKTLTMNDKGIETEKGLSALVDDPLMKSTFGDDLTFEISALFCDAKGANLRNNLAHGLMDSDQCNSVSAVYAWWLILKIVLMGFLDANSPRTPANSNNHDE